MKNEQSPEEKSRGGRPSSYKPEYAEQAYKLTAYHDATNEDLAAWFDKTTSTIDNWKNAHPEFMDALKKGKLDSDLDVVKSLHSRAVGYTCKEQKVFLYRGQPVVATIDKHYPPDPVACIFWLRNRQPDKWSKRANDAALPTDMTADDVKILSPDGPVPNNPVL